MGRIRKKKTYVNEQTVNYITKYVTKQDKDHKYYKAKILTSAGIGKKYINERNKKINEYKKVDTKETYTTRQGTELALPIYYRNKIYTEEEREKLWIEKLDKNERWVDGEKINIEKGEEKYYEALSEARKKNTRLGYGKPEIDWTRKRYEEQRREIMQNRRINKKKS